MNNLDMNSMHLFEDFEDNRVAHLDGELIHVEYIDLLRRNPASECIVICNNNMNNMNKYIIMILILRVKVCMFYRHFLFRSCHFHGPWFHL